LLGERCRSRLRREHPELRVELVDPVEILLAA
jgi:hypothetical protein